MIIIYHNPDCGTSRNVLGIIGAAGYDPVVVPYLQTGWTRAQLTTLFAAARVTASQALRLKGTRAEELGLAEADEDTILDAMIADPLLVNRPFVTTPLGTRLCRPSEVVLEILDQWPDGPLWKEDGTPILDAEGQRVG